MPKKRRDSYFVISYRDPKEGKILSLKSYSIQDSSLGLSFVAISDFKFDTNKVVVDPEEENLAKRLKDVKSLHLSIYSIVSIEEVGTDHEGLKFQKDKSNLFVLPTGDQPKPNGNKWYGRCTPAYFSIVTLFKSLTRSEIPDFPNDRVVAFELFKSVIRIDWTRRKLYSPLRPHVTRSDKSLEFSLHIRYTSLLS